MTVRENMQLLEERVRKATAYIARLRSDNQNLRNEIEQLERDIKLITGHNQELQSYVDTYKEDEELITKSIEASLESLNEVGLDNLDLTVADLETAEEFSAIGGDIVLDMEVPEMEMPDLNIEL